MGHVIQNEVRYIVPGFKFLTGDVTMFGFYDYGWAQINKIPAVNAAGQVTDTENIRRLTGFGFVGQLAKEGDFMARVMAAWQDTKSKPKSDPAERIPRVWFQVVKWF